MFDHLAAVQLSVHGRWSPQGGSVEEIWSEVHFGDEDSRSMTRQLADDQAVRTNGKAAPAGWASSAVVRADPKMILGRSALHGGRDDRFPDVVFRVDGNRLTSIVERLKQHFDTELFVAAIQFREAIVVTDGDTTSDPFDLECDEAVAW